MSPMVEPKPKAENGAAGDEHSVREVVETCLATDDLTPLLRLILDTETSGTTRKAAHASPGSTEPGPGQGPASEDRWAMVEVIQRCLEAVAAEQDGIIEEVCHSNALEISQCISELGDMQLLIQDLQQLLTGGNAALQAAGSALLSNSHSLRELTAVQANVARGMACVAGTRTVLGLCMDVGAALERGQLYHALLRVERIRGARLDPLMAQLTGAPPEQQLLGSSKPLGLRFTGTDLPVGSSGSPAPAPSPPLSLAARGASPGPNPSASALSLRAFFQNLLSELTAAAKQLAVSEFNSWLVSARTHAQRLGLRAIRRAAADRQLDEDLAKERRLMLTLLAAGQDVREIAVRLASAPLRLELQRDSAPGSLPGVVQARGMQGEGAAGGSRWGGGAGARGAGVGTAQSAAAAKAATQVLERAGTRRRKAPPPGDPDPPPPAAPRPDPPAPAGARPDIPSLHPGRPHAALAELLAWQRLQVEALKAGGSRPSASGPGPAAPGGGGGGGGGAYAVGVPAAALGSDTVMGLLHGFDLTVLLRCVHVHKVLGQLHKFQEYYVEQRRLQVTNDLAPPQNFLETYQSYLAQVTGFFVVESVVQRMVPELISQEQVMFLWEGAASSLKASLDLALESVHSAPIMVLLKDFVTLMCSALEQCGYATTAVEEVLLLSRPRYHDLLMSAVSQEISSVLEHDPLTEGHQLLSEAQVREMQGLGLPLVLEGVEGADLTPPLYAPFSKCIPGLLQQVRGFVQDSVSYLQGLFSPWELPQAIFYHSNRMITKVLVEELQSRVTAAAAAAALPPCLRMVANSWALLQALDALDAWTLAQAQPNRTAGQQEAGGGAGGKAQGNSSTSGVPAGAGRSRKAAAAQDAVASNAQVALRATQDLAERAVLRLLTQRVGRAIDKLRALPWLPPGPMSAGRSAYVDELIGILQDVFHEARPRLPRSSYLYLCRTVVRSMGTSILRLFAPEGAVKQYNLCAVQQLAGDVAELQAAASEAGVPDITLELAGPAQLCDLLLADKVEEVLVPELRRQRYPQLEVATIVVALDRYKELSKIGKDKTNFPTKKSMDLIAKQLRGQMVQGNATRSVGDF